MTGINGARVFVTGGTGFIGGRVVERLFLEAGADVTVLTSSYSRSARVSRFPVQIVQGSIMDREAVRAGLTDASVVIHCAVGNRGSDDQRRRETVDGTEILLAESLRAGVKRVVHLSTVAVYERWAQLISPKQRWIRRGVHEPAEWQVEETAPRCLNSGDLYSDIKSAAEKLALEYANQRGLAVAVLQPTIVYGPFGGAWTSDVLSALRSGRLVLVNAGTGLCNAVYVDDVVDAIFRAAHVREAAGQAFLISGERPITWRQFFTAFEDVAGCSSMVEMSAEAACAFYRAAYERPRSLLREALAALREDPTLRSRIMESRELAFLRTSGSRLPAAWRRAMKRRLKGESSRAHSAVPLDASRPILPMDPAQVRFYAAKPEVRIDKARRVLGYEPRFDFATGMALTGQWARWANLADAAPRHEN
jgi:nucleoside-diphosphate-sugar epimerase